MRVPRITGGRALEVTFNLCQSSDPDPGDELRYWFDYDGDDKQDEWGHCRATHLYKVGEFESNCVFSKACVSDRQPAHTVCHTYQVCTFGKPRPGASPSPSGSPGPSPSPSGSPEPSPSPLMSPSPSPSPSVSPSPSPSPSASPSPSPSPSESPSPSPSPSASPSPSPEPTPTPTPTPEPTPSPTPSPGLIDQHQDGDIDGPSSKDIWSFTAESGTDVTVKLDTVSQSTAYVLSVCISTSTQRRDCLTPTFKDRVACSFHNPFRIGCPVRSYSLPHSNGGRYYVIVSGYRLAAQNPGEYVMTMTAHPGTGPLGLESDNVTENPFLDQ